MRNIELIVIGAGPAGLSAAAEAAKMGVRVVLIDENNKPGGQLFKQIHKFFGSKAHMAGVRGYDLGNRLLQKTYELGAEIHLDTVVFGIYEDKRVAVIKAGKRQAILQAEKIILATGAAENALAFPGATLPGVMSAGAVQTMVNIHRVLPAKNVLTIGSGNVGLIVSYQILQAGGNVVALLEAASKIGGYGVHAAKVTRSGIPILVNTTVKRAYGSECLEGVTTIGLDDNFKPIFGTERDIEVGCLAMAVGLTPLAELAQLCGCAFTYEPRLGGLLPLHNINMETTVPGVYVAGDITGVEEASSAMEEGRLAGIAAAEALGRISGEACDALKAGVWSRLNMLRAGKFGQYRQDLKTKIIEQRRVAIER